MLSEQLYTVKEAAEYLGVCTRTVHRHIKKRHLTAQKGLTYVGNQLRTVTNIKKSDLDSFKDAMNIIKGGQGW